MDVLPDDLCLNLAVTKDSRTNRTLSVKSEIELCAAKNQTTPGFEPWTVVKNDNPTAKFVKKSGGKNVNQTSYFGGL